MRTTSDTGVTATLFWSNETYTVGAGGWLKPTSLTSPTTPTTVSQRGLVPRWMRRPSGSAPGQCWSANSWLTTATDGCSMPSLAAKSRPLQERNPHRLEIARTAAPELHDVRLAVGRRLPLDLHGRHE